MFGFRRFFILLTLIGTAIIASNIDNDTGGITVYSIARANYGYNMLWTPIPIVFLLIIIQEMSSRTGSSTEKGLPILYGRMMGPGRRCFLLTFL
jgi:Mn2+/Fe2+ NRAMP family transporter